jgi:hypothetical protein
MNARRQARARRLCKRIVRDDERLDAAARDLRRAIQRLDEPNRHTDTRVTCVRELLEDAAKRIDSLRGTP